MHRRKQIWLSVYARRWGRRRRRRARGEGGSEEATVGWADGTTHAHAWNTGQAMTPLEPQRRSA
eukprot:366190-Chlamydomonas_euryale.AAC.8